jgi:hypothetical protein
VHHKLTPFHSVLKVIATTFTQSHGIPQSSNRLFYSTALRRLGHLGPRLLAWKDPQTGGADDARLGTFSLKALSRETIVVDASFALPGATELASIGMLMAAVFQLTLTRSR